MNTIILPERHFIFNAEGEVNKICQPLFNSTDITAFYYMRYFNDNTCYILTTKSNSISYRFKTKYPINPVVEANRLNEKFMYIVNMSDPKNQLMIDHYQRFDIGTPLYLIERYENYFDSFHFHGNFNNQNIVNIYLSNMNFLEKFKFFFKEKAKKLIDKSQSNKLVIPEFLQPSFKGLNKNSKIANTQNQIAQQIDVKRYIFSGKYEGKSLTKREIEALVILAKGRTVKEVAKIVGIAPRTVETYINNAKNKLGIDNKTGLMDFMLDLNL